MCFHTDCDHSFTWVHYFYSIRDLTLTQTLPPKHGLRPSHAHFLIQGPIFDSGVPSPYSSDLEKGLLGLAFTSPTKGVEAQQPYVSTHLGLPFKFLPLFFLHTGRLSWLFSYPLKLSSHTQDVSQNSNHLFPGSWLELFSPSSPILRISQGNGMWVPTFGLGASIFPSQPESMYFISLPWMMCSGCVGLRIHQAIARLRFTFKILSTEKEYSCKPVSTSNFLVLAPLPNSFFVNFQAI